MRYQDTMKRAATAAALWLSLGLAAEAQAEPVPELWSFALDPTGAVLVASPEAHEVYRVEMGETTVLAGTGEAGFAGDGGPAAEAVLDRPDGVAIDADGNIYVRDSGNRKVRRIDAFSGEITTVAEIREPGDEPFIKLLAPGAEPFLTIGRLISIRWTHNLGNAARFGLELSRDGGESWTPLASEVQGSRYDWRVKGPETENARIRISATAEVESVVQVARRRGFRNKIVRETVKVSDMSDMGFGVLYAAE